MKKIASIVCLVFIVSGCATPALKETKQKIEAGDYHAHAGVLVSYGKVSHLYCYTILEDLHIYEASNQLIREERVRYDELIDLLDSVVSISTQRFQRNRKLSRELQELEKYWPANLKAFGKALDYGVYETAFAQLMHISEEQSRKSSQLKDAIITNEHEWTAEIKPVLEKLQHLVDEQNDRLDHLRVRLRQIEEEKEINVRNARLITACRDPLTSRNKEDHKRSFAWIERIGYAKPEGLIKAPNITIMRTELQLECLKKSRSYGWVSTCDPEEVLLAGKWNGDFTQDAEDADGEKKSRIEEILESSTHIADLETTFLSLKDQQSD